jgi:solute carrier family 25 iron transporter 28/37
MELTIPQGPAHAVYFGTYEIVKDMAGGNKQDGKHHPLAAGKAPPPQSATHRTDEFQHPAVLPQPLPVML